MNREPGHHIVFDAAIVMRALACARPPKLDRVGSGAAEQHDVDGGLTARIVHGQLRSWSS